MIQFLNNIWMALSTENVELVNMLILPAGFIEPYLSMILFLIIFNVSATRKQKILYVICSFIISTMTLNFIPSPYNVFINYTCVLFLINKIFKLNLLKSFISLIFSSLIFGLLNTLLQNPYITLLKINPNAFISTPIYRIPYLIILYTLIFTLCLLLKRFRNIKFNLSSLDTLDKKTLRLLCINLFVGLLTICTQLITTSFYIDIVPISISILNFILLISFLILSIYSFTRMIKLYNTRKDLECAEDYNKSLEILYDNVKGFKHDFDNIVSTLDGFIENNDMNGLKNYFRDMKKDCKITNNLSILNPRIINNPGIYSLLNNKYFKALNSGINFDIEYFIDLNKLKVNFYELSRMLGILIDNAIEEAEKCSEKIVKLSFIRENKNNRVVISVKNTYLNKDVNTETIFEKGASSKENHSGIGLWEVRNYLKKGKNLDLFTSKTDKFFSQELFIYDFVKK